MELDWVGRLGDGPAPVSSVPVTIRDAETARLATSNDSAAVAERRLESASSDSTAPDGTWLTSRSVTRSPVASAAAFTRVCTTANRSSLPTVLAIGPEWCWALVVELRQLI